MPAKSKKQRKSMAIAEHHPEMLNKKNRGMLMMSKNQLHDMASTPEKNLPKKSANDIKKAAKAKAHGSGPFNPSEFNQGFKKLGEIDQPKDALMFGGKEETPAMDKGAGKEKPSGVPIDQAPCEMPEFSKSPTIITDAAV